MIALLLANKISSQQYEPFLRIPDDYVIQKILLLFTALQTSKNTGRMRQIIRAAFLEFSIGMVQVSLLTLWVRSKIL